MAARDKPSWVCLLTGFCNLRLIGVYDLFDLPFRLADGDDPERAIKLFGFDDLHARIGETFSQTADRLREGRDHITHILHLCQGDRRIRVLGTVQNAELLPCPASSPVRNINFARYYKLIGNYSA